MKFAFQAIALLALTSSCSNHSLNEESILGCWTSMEEKKMECWEKRGDTLYGEGLALQDMGVGVMDTVLWESFKLYTDSGARKYVVNVQGQEPVTFTETSPWVFENPEHDFPKLLKYTFNPKGDLEVTVGEGEEAFMWVFRRNK